MKILIIEDEDDMRTALSRGLIKSGYSVDTVSTGDEGLSWAISEAYDLILLDLNLPGMDGLEILQTIRKKDWQQKILILSARSSISQRVEGLNLGANDYLIKPFDFSELAARVNNLLRRDFLQKKPALVYGSVTVDTVRRLVTGPGGAPIQLAPKEFAILEYLFIHKGRPVSAEELIEHAWAENEANLFSNAVKVQISTLRKKLQQAGCDEIVQTIRGVGYCIGYGGTRYE